MIQSTPHNFKDIFTWNEDGQQVGGIVIPIIQRDYAQGRTSDEVTIIRERFLNALYNALVNDQKQTLDFIYGNIETCKLHGKKTQVLTPLDGQQRLTTLFLLHYYIAKHENIEEEQYAFLRFFSYETRSGSRDFCEKLVGFNPDFSQLELRSQIEDEAWFLLEWESDPTVQSMLVMLDAIHEHFKDTSGLWEKITGDAITFYFLPINEMGLTDELYIKMNSRGKPLTQFEHWKAELELSLKDVEEDLSKQIAHKIDTDWTDLLWPYRDSGTGDAEADSVIDDEFLHYVHFVSDIICFKNGMPEIEKDFDIIKKLFSTDCEKAKENAEFLIDFFDIWVKIEPTSPERKKTKIFDFFSRYLSSTHQENQVAVGKETDLFAECCRNSGLHEGNRRKFPYNRFLLLYAFVLFLQNRVTITDEQFTRRLRMLNNLAANSRDTMRDDYISGLMRQTEEIIINGIAKESTEGKDHFNNTQMREEAEKLQWTNDNPDKAEMLYRLEDHPYLNGHIASVGLDHVDLCDRFYSLFSQDLNQVNRALLSIGDIFVEDSFRYQIGTSDSRLATGVWRDILGPVKLQENLSEALRVLLAKHEEFTDRNLQEVSWNYLQSAREMPVRYYLVKYSQMIHDRWGKYYWRDHDEIGRNSYHVLMMMTEFSTGGKTYDIFLKALYDIAGRDEVGLELGDYSQWEYNNHGTDKLYLRNQGLYLTLNDNRYSICQIEGDEVVESYYIQQNENGIDIEDRVLVGLRLLNKYLHIYDEDTIRQYVAQCEWTFAKTMPQWPHEYIVKEKCPLTKEQFEHFVWTQRVLGKVEDWGRYRQPYLYLNGYKYWTMGCELEATTVINRAKISE